MVAGVSWHKSSNAWRARIKGVEIGYFTTPNLAAAAISEVNLIGLDEWRNARRKKRERPRAWGVATCQGGCGNQVQFKIDRASADAPPVCNPCRRRLRQQGAPVQMPTTPKSCLRCDESFLGNSRTTYCSLACRTHEKRQRVRARKVIMVMSDCTYTAAHRRCWREWGRAADHPCVDCQTQAREWAYDGTDPTELCGEDEYGPGRVYSRFPEFYMPLCRQCHVTRDKVWRRKLQNEFRDFSRWKSGQRSNGYSMPSQQLIEQYIELARAGRRKAS